MNRILATLFVGLFLFPISAGMAETTEDMKEDLSPYLPDVSAILSLRPGWKSQQVTEYIPPVGTYMDMVSRTYRITSTGTFTTQIQRGKYKIGTSPDHLSVSIDVRKRRSFEDAQAQLQRDPIIKRITEKSFTSDKYSWEKKFEYGQIVLPNQLFCLYCAWRGEMNKRIIAYFIKGKYIVSIEILGNDDDFLKSLPKQKRETIYPLITQASVPSLDDLEKLANLMDSKIPSLGAQTPAQQPYLLKFETDKTVYETGERIFLKGSVSKLVDVDRRMYEGVKKAPLRLKVEFPQVPKPKELSFPKDQPVTDDVGEFSFAPFACAVEGSLTVTAILSTQDYPKLQTDLTTNVSVKIVSAPLPTDAQMEQLVKAFKKEVPSHRKEVEESADTSAPLLEFSNGYGNVNNATLGFNGYHCYGYQTKTMRFLNSVRFSKDEHRSRLLRGLEYGPIMRGIQASRGPCGEHHAVALYRRNEDWKKSAKVLDPWPEQRPEVYSIEDFRKFYGSEYFDWGRWTVQESPIWTRCVPMLQLGPRTEGQIYWNLDIKQLGFDYPEDPSEGLEKTDVVIAHCPVILRITDGQGRRIGLGDKREIVAEIPGSQFFLCPDGKGGHLWYASFPHGAYNIEFVGTADGTCRSLVRRAGSYLELYELPVRKDETAILKLEPDKDAQPIMLSGDRKIPPLKLPCSSSTKTTEGRRPGTHSRTLIIAVAAVVSLIVIWRLLSVMIHRGKTPENSEKT